MKSLSFLELNSYIHWAEQMLLGAQLQNVWTNDRYLVLEFYKFRNLWLLCDLDGSQPQLVLLQKEAPSIAKRPKPVGLFLNSHGCGLRVEALKTRPEWGRAIELCLGSRERTCTVEMQLIPTSVNVIVGTQVIDAEKSTKPELKSQSQSKSQSKIKSISWNKLKTLPRLQHPTSEVMQGLEEQWLAREDEWWSSQRPKSTVKDPRQQSIAMPKIDLTKIVEKKSRALETMEKSLGDLEKNVWAELGESLKSIQKTEDLPVDLRQLLDDKLSRSQNIERAFKKAKDSERKYAGTVERISKLKLEIEELMSPDAEARLAMAAATKSSGTKTLQKAEARGRKLQLADGREAVCGRSGRDNLAILRKARAWDLWLHLKDYPGAHAIIFREKQQTVSSQELELVCEWLIRESPAARGFSWGAKYEVIVAETRYVRPIKGDSLGRVTYQNPTIYTFASKPQKG